MTCTLDASNDRGAIVQLDANKEGLDTSHITGQAIDARIPQRSRLYDDTLLILDDESDFLHSDAEGNYTLGRGDMGGIRFHIEAFSLHKYFGKEERETSTQAM